MITTGVVPIGGPRLKSRREARKVTSQFHKLQNEIGEILNATDDANDSDTPTQNRSALSSNKKQQLYVLEKSIEAMGGRDRYQQASVVTTSHHSTSKWVVSGATPLQRILFYITILHLLAHYVVHSFSTTHQPTQSE